MEWGYFTTKPILDIETIYKICACDLLRRSIFYSLSFWKFSEFFYIASNPICYKVKRKIESEEEVLCLERNTGKNDHFIEKSKIDLEQKNE